MAPRPLLFHRVVTADDQSALRALVLLHGILGQGRNWHGIAQALVHRLPDWAVVLVDLRMHGRSQGFPPPHTVDACAEDLLDLMEHLPFPTEAVAGHSFGGKVALALAQEAPEDLEQVFVLDANPAAGKAATRVARLLTLLQTVPMPQPSRDAFISYLASRGLDRRTAQWVATNLRAQGRTFNWGVDLQAIEGMLRDFLRRDFLEFLARSDPSVAVRFVAAAESPVFSSEMIHRIQDMARNGRISIDVLPRAGHWLHVDNPNGLLEIFFRYL